MTFNEYLAEIKGWLESKYPKVNFNDYAVSNKLEELALIIAKRNNDPNPAKEERPTLIDTDPEWRGFR
jgi:hypothetical protein